MIENERQKGHVSKNLLWGLFELKRSAPQFSLSASFSQTDKIIPKSDKYLDEYMKTVLSVCLDVSMFYFSSIFALK